MFIDNLWKQDSYINIDGWPQYSLACVKSIQIQSFFWSAFSCIRIVFYSLNLHIQGEYREIRTRKNSVFEHFSFTLCRNYRKCLIASLWSVPVRYEFLNGFIEIRITMIHIYHQEIHIWAALYSSLIIKI